MNYAIDEMNYHQNGSLLMGSWDFRSLFSLFNLELIKKGL